MFAIIGATGNVGRATAAALREAGLPVRAIVREEARAARLREIGCEIARADLQDAEALARAIGDADTVQAIVPVSPRSKDPAADLRRSIDRLTEALDIARPRRVLAISDYGAHVADDIGMPSMFRELEARLRRLEAHTLIVRSAEHMHNWGRVIPAAMSSGVLTTFQDPIDMVQPTIAAHDLGAMTAELLRRPLEGNGVEVIHAEGPRRYSASDVAAAVSQLSGKVIRAQAVPRATWRAAFAHMAPSLAELLIKTNDAKNRGGLVDVEPDAREVLHGTTVLIDGLRPVVST